jgi:uncharacterized protein YceK
MLKYLCLVVVILGLVVMSGCASEQSTIEDEDELRETVTGVGDDLDSIGDTLDDIGEDLG